MKKHRSDSSHGVNYELSLVKLKAKNLKQKRQSEILHIEKVTELFTELSR